MYAKDIKYREYGITECAFKKAYWLLHQSKEPDFERDAMATLQLNQETT